MISWPWVVKEQEATRQLEDLLAKHGEKKPVTPKSKVEILARAYCEELGYDPDAKYYLGYHAGVPMWQRFEAEARAALHASAMDRALDRLKRENDSTNPQGGSS